MANNADAPIAHSAKSAPNNPPNHKQSSLALASLSAKCGSKDLIGVSPPNRAQLSAAAPRTALCWRRTSNNPVVKRMWHSLAYKTGGNELLQKRIQQLSCFSTVTWIIGRLSHAHGTYNLAMRALRHFQLALAFNPKYAQNATHLLIRRNSQHNQSNDEIPHKNLLHHAQLQPPFRKTQQTDRHGTPGPAPLYQRKTASRRCVKEM